MRRLEVMLSLCFALLGTQPIWAQTIWSPCGCDDQCSSACSGCQATTCGHGTGCLMDCLTKHDPEYFQPWNARPFGSFNEHVMQTQRRNGIVAQFVFHQHDFTFNETDGFWGLSDSGVLNAEKLARLWQNAPAKILVEPSGRVDWDNARHQLAVQALVSNGLSVSNDDVVIGHSHILGLVPTEPESIYNRRQQLSPFVQGNVSSGSVGSGSTLSNASSASGSSGSRPRN